MQVVGINLAFWIALVSVAEAGSRCDASLAVPFFNAVKMGYDKIKEIDLELTPEMIEDCDFGRGRGFLQLNFNGDKITVSKYGSSGSANVDIYDSFPKYQAFDGVWCASVFRAFMTFFDDLKDAHLNISPSDFQVKWESLRLSSSVFGACRGLVASSDGTRFFSVVIDFGAEEVSGYLRQWVSYQEHSNKLIIQDK